MVKTWWARPGCKGAGDDAWTWWIVGLFGCPASCCMSCVRAPWTWGLFMCFCALFSPLNVEGVYNEHSHCCNCNYLTSKLPSSCVSLGRACTVLPPVSLWFRSRNNFPATEEVLPTAEEWACSLCYPRCLHAQHANSDSHFLSSVHGLLRAIACRAAGKVRWTVPPCWDERCG